MLRNFAVPLAAAVCVAALAAPVLAADKIPAAVAAAVADAARPATDSARDAGRKPAETIAFAGVKPGDTVAELSPGGGYFTRILAKVVGPKGHVYAINSVDRFAGAVKTLAADPAYANVTAPVMPYAAIKLDAPVDVVWTSENYHDMHGAPGADLAPMNKAIFDALKPGGTYFVLDHAAGPGATADEMRTLHRIDPAIVKKEVLAAGFVLAGESTILKRADNYTLTSHDPLVHDKTDQFVLKFRRPK